MATTALIVREHAGHRIRQRPDGYLDATAMCKAEGKIWANYWKSPATQEFAAALADNILLGMLSLVEAKRGKNGGTWVHPRLGLDLARWLSPTFAVVANGWVFDLMTAGSVSIKETPPAAALPWSLRLSKSFEAHSRFINGRSPGWWSIVTATSTPLMVLEDCLLEHCLPLTPRDQPDGSIGKFWATLRRARGLPGLERFAPLSLPDRRRVVDVNIYPPEERGAFDVFFHTDYVPRHMPGYLLRKFGDDHGRLPPLSAADRAALRISDRPAELDMIDRAQLAEQGGTVKAVPLLAEKSA